jgi:hypothetical protein
MVYRGSARKMVMVRRKNKYVVYGDDGYIVIMSRMKDICTSHARLVREKLIKK